MCGPQFEKQGGSLKINVNILEPRHSLFELLFVYFMPIMALIGSFLDAHI